MTTVTKAQREALEAIRDGAVSRYYPWGRGEPHWYVSKPFKVRGDVITRCIDARLARVGPRTNALFAPVELTTDGRKALPGA